MGISFTGSFRHLKQFKARNPRLVFLSALDALNQGYTESGIYTISPDGQNKFELYCNQDIFGGGWTQVARFEYANVGSATTTTSVNPTDTNGYIEDQHWQVFNSNATFKVLFEFYGANGEGPYYARTPMTAGTCQEIHTTLMPAAYGTNYLWAWTDPGCNLIGIDYTYVTFDSDKIISVDNRNRRYAEYWNGSGWTEPRPSIHYGTPGYVNIYVK